MFGSSLRNVIIGTVVGTIVTEKIIKSQVIRKAVVNTMAQGIKLQKDAAFAYESMKEDAEDLYEERKNTNKPASEIAE